MANPFSDFWNFVIGNTEDYNALGTWKYLLVVLFVVLIAASITIAIKNWQEDPSQRTGSHFGTWLVRVLVGGMWFQGMLWKLPLPVSGGFRAALTPIGDPFPAPGATSGPRCAAPSAAARAHFTDRTRPPQPRR